MPVVKKQNINHLRKWLPVVFLFGLSVTVLAQNSEMRQLQEVIARSPRLSLLQANPAPAAYHYQDLAFFCKLEVQLEERLRVPMKFRLGSVDYVNFLEGKNRFQLNGVQTGRSSQAFDWSQIPPQN